MLQYGCSQRATDEPLGIPILRMNNLQADGWDLDDLKYVELSDVETLRWQLQSGDIVFNRTNSKELVGKCEVFKESGVWVFASYLMRLRVDREQAEPEFVAAFLNTRAGRIQIDRESRQIIGMANINAEEIRTLRIPLPEPSRQRELVRVLSDARSLQQDHLKRAAALLKSIDSFVLDALAIAVPNPKESPSYAVHLREARVRFDPDYNSPRFRTLRKKIQSIEMNPMSVSSLFEPIVSGFAAGADDQTDDPSIGVPHIRPLNITADAALTFEGTKMVPRSSLNPLDLLKKGELLFNNTNSTAWVGKTVVFDVDFDCACSNHMTRLTLKNDEYNPYYFAAVLNALRGMGYLGLLATNFNNQAGINVDTLREIRVPVPDPVIQNEIASEVQQRQREARRLRDEATAIWDRATREFETELLGPVADESAELANRSRGRSQ